MPRREFGLSRAYQQSGDTDHAREHLKKFQYITQNKIGAPMSLAYGEQGQYSRAVESPSAVLKAPAQIKVRFVDVTKEAGIVSTPKPEVYVDQALFRARTGSLFSRLSTMMARSTFSSQTTEPKAGCLFTTTSGTESLKM